MSSTSAPSTNDLALPVAVIVCIAVVCYTALVIIAFVIRWAILKKGLCGGDDCCKCKLCGSEEPLECTCCVGASESCNCDPSMNKCLNKICPNRKDVQAFWRHRNVSCVDVLLCQCFAGPNNCCTNQEEEDMCCVCPCPGTYEHIDICCFEVGLRTTESVREREAGYDLYGRHPSSSRNINRQRSTLDRKSSTLVHKPSTLGRKSSTVVQVIEI